MTATVAELVPGMRDADYFNAAGLSQSGAKDILRSPALYRYRREHPEPPTDAMLFGTAFHTRLLGSGPKVVVVEVENRRGKAWSEPAGEATAAGAVPITAVDDRHITGMVAAVHDHEAAALMLGRPGEAEVAMFWDEAASDGTKVPCRGKADWVTSTVDGRPVIVDVKTAADASRPGFTRSVANFGYDIQHAAYLRGHMAATGSEPGFVFVAVEKAPPYLVGVYSLDWDFADHGLTRWLDAVDTYAACVAADTWPGYAAGIVEIERPGWHR